MATRTLAARDYPAGEVTVDLPQNAAKRYSSFRLGFTRAAWPNGTDCVLDNGIVVPSTALQIFVEESLDGGTNWRAFSSVTFPGGDAFDASGNLAPESALIVELPVARTSQLRVRAKTFVPLRTAISLDVTDA